MRVVHGLMASLEVAFNRLFEFDENSAARLAALSGKVIGIELRGFGLTFYLMPMTDGVVVSDSHEGEVDTWLRGTPVAMLEVALKGDRQAFYQGKLVIEGDMETGRRVQRLLQELDIDWQELLAQNVGDVLAHEVGRGIGAINEYAVTSLRSLLGDGAEYLQEEQRLVPAPSEVEAFNHAVDELRDDVERLSARLARIKSSMEAPE